MEVGTNFGHNLRGEVDGIVGVGLEERGLLEIVGEESSGLSEDAADEFEFFSLLFKVVVLLNSLCGGSINNSLEFISSGVLSGSLSNLLLLDGGQVIELVLEFN